LCETPLWSALTEATVAALELGGGGALVVADVLALRGGGGTGVGSAATSAFCSLAAPVDATAMLLGRVAVECCR